MKNSNKTLTETTRFIWSMRGQVCMTKLHFPSFPVAPQEGYTPSALHFVALVIKKKIKKEKEM